MLNVLDYNNIEPPFYNDHSELEDSVFEELKSRCLKSREFAYCPYSKFRVGCSILTEEGVFVDGANVENASFGAVICAERTTIAKLVSSGYKKFQVIAICADSKEVITPCGICRQVIREFAYQDNLMLPIYLFNEDGKLFIKMYLKDLLPLSFGPGSF